MVNPQQLSNAIYGVSGLILNDWEKGFLREQRPFGMIVFARNIESPEQLKRLTDSMREASANEKLLVLIDQEGGRVARLKPPHWPLFPAADKLAECFTRNVEAGEQATYLNYRKIALQLAPLGINVDCAPMCDLRLPGCHDIVGDRSFGETPEQVARLAQAAADGLKAGGVLPIIKHIPGHGRAMVDSHESLPVVDASHEELSRTDFVPFKLLNDELMAMTAHIRYTKLDKDHSATHSEKVIRIIREEIGFDNLLMTDDLSMKALEGNFTERAELAIKVGCDVLLHCNGNREEMEAVAKGVSLFSGSALARASRVLDELPLQADEVSAAELDEQLNGLLTA